MPIYICVHRTVAVSLGLGFSRIRSTPERAALLYVVCPSSNIRPPLHPPQPPAGQRYLHQLLHETSQVLGERLQVSTHPVTWYAICHTIFSCKSDSYSSMPWMLQLSVRCNIQICKISNQFAIFFKSKSPANSKFYVVFLWCTSIHVLFFQNIFFSVVIYTLCSSNI